MIRSGIDAKQPSCALPPGNDDAVTVVVVVFVAVVVVGVVVHAVVVTAVLYLCRLP